jgi:hypothetical protein
MGNREGRSLATRGELSLNSLERENITSSLDSFAHT